MISRLLLSTLLFFTGGQGSPISIGDALAELDLGFSNLASDSHPKYFKLDAKKYRGSCLEDAEYGAQAQVLVERDGSSDGYLLMELSNQNTFYLADIEIGTPAQKVGVLVDTGSSDLWVVASNNSYCMSGTGGSLNSKARALDDIYNWNEPTTSVTEDDVSFTLQNKAVSSSSSANQINCSQYGTFDPKKSETHHNNGTSFSISYADGTFANGVWGYDDVIINGANVTNLSFAVCDDADSAMGILGIGLAGLETTYSGSTSLSLSSSSGPYQYENLPLRLKSTGIIDYVAFSVYLNDADADSASILFGAIDSDHYTGDIYTLPIINTLKSKGYGYAIELDVTLNSITLVDSNSNTQATVGSGATSALLDTGTTLTYVPSDVLTNILNLINAQYSSSIGYYVVGCSDVSDYSLSFNFQGFPVTIELSEFLVPLVTTTGSTAKYCMVGIQSSESTTITLGDNFLRNVYMVADYAKMEIGLAVASHSNSSSTDNITVLTSGIPNAVSADSSLLWSSSNSLTVQSNVQMSSIPTSQTSYSFQTNTATSTSKGKAGKTTTTSKTSSSTDNVESTSISVSSISSQSSSHNVANTIGMNGFSIIGTIFLLMSALL